MHQTQTQTHPAALVLGGSGAIGQEVVRALAQAQLPAWFTYHQDEARARSLSEETGARAIKLDLCDQGSIDALVRELGGQPPRYIAHCAGLSPADGQLQALTAQSFNQIMAINCGGFVQLIRALSALDRAEEAQTDVVCVGALAPAQSLPLPVAFAASQGALNATCMALAHELSAQGWRFNVLSSGLLERGLSEHLAPSAREAYTRYSAMQRLGQPEEVAKAVRWLLTQNSYLNGKIVPVNGGI